MSEGLQAFLFRWGQGRGLWAIRCAEPLDLLILLCKRARALASALLVDVDLNAWAGDEKLLGLLRFLLGCSCLARRV